MHKILLSAAFLPAMVYTAATTPQSPLLPPGQVVGWGPNTGSPVWSQTGLGPSPFQGQPYGAGTPGAPNYPFIQAPSTDPAVYGTNDPDYIKNLNLQVLEQQANIVNQQMYQNWVLTGQKGPPPQYVGIDENAWQQWWAQYSANPGQDAPPQNFWTGVDPNNSFTNWLGSGGSYAGAPIGNPPIQSPVNITSINGASGSVAISAGNTSLFADLEQAKQLLLSDAAWSKDPAIQQALADAAAELAAAQKQ
jgi:hypothetical protein